MRRNDPQWPAVQASGICLDVSCRNFGLKFVIADGHFLLRKYKRWRLWQKLVPHGRGSRRPCHRNRQLKTFLCISLALAPSESVRKIQLQAAELASVLFAAMRFCMQATRHALVTSTAVCLSH